MNLRPRADLVLPVLGVPVRFEVPEPGPRAAVERAYGRWRALADDLVSAPPRPPLVRLRLADGVAPAAPGALRVETTPDGRGLLMDRPGLTGRATLDGMSGVAEVAEPLLEDAATMEEALDTLVLFLLTRLDRQPVHAALLARGGAGLVLTGPSGVGKSTLAQAAVEAGLRVLGDDAVYVQLRPRFRAWGLGRPLHLLPRAAEWFPTLATRPLVRRPGGPKARVDLPPDGAGPPMVERTALCLLERGEAPRVERLAVEAAVAASLQALAPGFDVFRDTVGARLRAAARGGAWRVVVGTRPHDALSALLEIVPAARG